MSEDRILQQRVIDELAFDPAINASHIGVSADGGVITLTGHVDTFSAKFAAERAARRVRGVKAIAQEIEVHLPSDKKTADDEIAVRAIKMLEWDVAIPPDSIRVRVEHGTVTLTGEVEWAYQRAEAEHDVRRLGGVQVVLNQIAIRPRAQPADVRAKITAAFERTAELDASAVTVDVKGSKVILGGQVQSWIEHDDALRAAWSVPGVASVEDEILILRS